ncbi:MAG: ABC transporter ATP-binding protein [Alphaproteobacteria bacterium]
MSAFGLETAGLTKRFGSFTALDDVSMAVSAGSFHVLLGENGAGKSTLVKCVMGYYQADAGRVLIDGTPAVMQNPRDAHAQGIGMVYQHFTLVPSMTVAENLVMARADVPEVIDWKAETKQLDSFIERMPFRVPFRSRVQDLSAGERQKTEILKQLYLERHFLILDEPTSVLTPGEADEMLGLLRGMTEAGQLTILMISHKFREVFGYAEAVTVLRRGRHAGGGLVKDLSREDMASMMIGAVDMPASDARCGERGMSPVLVLHDLEARDDTGMKGIAIDRLDVHAREIVGIAGISGNGQKELVEVLGGQRTPTGGELIVDGETYAATRTDAKAKRVHCLPEEPLRNASVARMSVADNLAFRAFDRKKANGNGADHDGAAIWLDLGAIARRARELIKGYGIKTASKDAPIATLSGGNVQRTVLARELSEAVNLLIVANPCFGLDFAAVAEIRSQIMRARNNGAAVLLVSEDLDELLELSDRILVMSEGRIVYETPIATADIQTIGTHMAGAAPPLGSTSEGLSA